MQYQDPSTPLNEVLAYSPKDAARVTGLGVTTIFRLINEGQLDRRKIGSRSLITAASVRQLIEGEATQ